MKLAEALQLRADLQKRMEQLAARLYDNATVQEGEAPAEDPVALLEEYEVCAAQLEEMMARINRTNCETRRDCLKLRAGTYRNFLTCASSLTRRSTRSEIKICSSVPVPVYRKRADELACRLREVDNAIQAANWTTELL